ncbi:MAG TPA: VWA domain-containing protein [Vicinamibacterales bacterium]|mgnify:CR=1 FL=1|nr:VWA domain-containing protein [Vicinamibacterales bacterium]
MANRAGVACAAVALAALLQGPLVPVTALAQQPPSFKSGVDVIAVDVSIVDKEGQPVGGLDADRFEVAVDGKPRRVVSATFVDYASAAAGAGSAPLTGRPLQLGASFASNEREEEPSAIPGRVVVLAVDQLSFAPGAARAAIESAQRFLDRLQPADRVGVVAYPAPGPVVAPTVEHGVVRAALERVVGLGETGQPVAPYLSMSEAMALDRNDPQVRQQVIERECAGLKQPAIRGAFSEIESCVRRIDGLVPQMLMQLQTQGARSLNGLQSVVNDLDRISGVKTLIVISAGMLPSSSARLDLRRDIQAVAAAAASANVRIYVLHVQREFLQAVSAEMARPSPTVFDNEIVLASGLQMLAGLSAGSIFTVASGADRAFDRVARESSAAYILGIEPEAGDRDGKSHRIQVRVRNLPNALVRSRSSFVVPAPSAAPPTPEAAVTAALKPGRLAKDLPVQFTAHAMRDPRTGEIRLLMSANIGRGVAGPAEVRVGYAVSDQTGRVLGSAVDKLHLDQRGAGPSASWSYLNAIGLRPGAYTLRVAAADEGGRTGSAEYRIDAKLTAGDGMALSDLFVFDPARPARQDWKMVVDGRIDGTAIEVGVEMYPLKGKGSVTAVAFDVTDRPDGPAMVGARAKPVSGDSGRRLLAAADVDLRLLPPGDYLVVATAYDKDKILGRVSRPFRRDPMATDAVGAPRAALGVGESGGLIRAFDRLDVLTAGALEFFLARLSESDAGAASEAVASASAALRAGQFDAALAALSGAAPERLSVPFLKGLALLGKGDLEPAAAEFRSALRVSSEFLPAAFYLGACYAAGGRDREAAGAWQTSLVSESGAPIVFDVLADAWLRVGDGERAEAIAREAMGLWPEDDRFVPRLAAAQTMQKRSADALATLARYLEAHPDDASAIFLAMRILFDARTAGVPVAGAAEDAERAAALAAAYRAAGGRQAALVDRWALYVQQPRRR